MPKHNRKKTEDFILSNIEKMLPGSPNGDLYRAFFKRMSDDEFDQFMKKLESGEINLPITAPNFANYKLSVERNIEIAKDLGHDFFERLWISATDDCPKYLTPIKYLVVDLPTRRASQSLVKKISVQETDKTVDMLSGQPTGDSRKGAKISFPELQVLAAMGLDNTVVELMKYRGGDIKGRNAMNAMIDRHGSANMKVLSNYASGVESVKTLKTFLTCAHLKNTL